MKRAPFVLLGWLTVILPKVAFALPHESGSPDDLLGRPIVLVVALALTSLLPFAFMGLTAFAKISTVLQIARSAIGAASVPSNTIVLALSAALTILAMAPVVEQVQARLAPVVATSHTADTVTLITDTLSAVRSPIQSFLKKNASEKERLRFLDVARKGRTADEQSALRDDDFSILVPSFVVTELGKAFAIGFLIYLPFLVIDLVVSNVLLALGMQMMNPTQVSLPFKLLLFVAIDGWGMLSQALVSSYR